MGICAFFSRIRRGIHSNGWRQLFCSFCHVWLILLDPSHWDCPNFSPSQKFIPLSFFSHSNFHSWTPGSVFLPRSACCVSHRLLWEGGSPLHAIPTLCPPISTFPHPTLYPAHWTLPNASGIQCQLCPSSCSGPAHSQLWWTLTPGSHFHSQPSLLFLHCETPASRCVESDQLLVNFRRETVKMLQRLSTNGLEKPASVMQQISEGKLRNSGSNMRWIH